MRYSKYTSVDGRTYNKEYNVPTSTDAYKGQVARVFDAIEIKERHLYAILGILSGEEKLLHDKTYQTEENSSLVEKVYGVDLHSKNLNHFFKFNKKELLDKLQSLYPKAKEYDSVVKLHEDAVNAFETASVLDNHSVAIHYKDSDIIIERETVSEKSILNSEKFLLKREREILKDVKEILVVLKSEGYTSVEAIPLYEVYFSDKKTETFYKKSDAKKAIKTYCSKY